MLFGVLRKTIFKAIKRIENSNPEDNQSQSGAGGPYSTAITADGSIIASIITASMIKTGVLQSFNSKS